MSKRLTEEHPFKQKINELENWLEMNGVIIAVSQNTHGLCFKDKNTNEAFDLKTFESGEIELECPSFLEFKLTIEE